MSVEWNIFWSDVAIACGADSVVNADWRNLDAASKYLEEIGVGWERFWKVYFFEENGKRRRKSICATIIDTKEDIRRHCETAFPHLKIVAIVEGKTLEC